MLIEQLKQALIRDFTVLHKKIGKKPITACAILTDSDFTTASLILNVQTNQKLEPYEYWDIENWQYDSNQLENDATAELSPVLREFVKHSPERAREKILPLFIQALSELKRHMRQQNIATDSICFFITISDNDDAPDVEDYSAQQLNSGSLLTEFLRRYMDISSSQLNDINTEQYLHEIINAYEHAITTVVHDVLAKTRAKQVEKLVLFTGKDFNLAELRIVTDRDEISANDDWESMSWPHIADITNYEELSDVESALYDLYYDNGNETLKPYLFQPLIELLLKIKKRLREQEILSEKAVIYLTTYQSYGTDGDVQEQTKLIEDSSARLLNDEDNLQSFLSR